MSHYCGLKNDADPQQLVQSHCGAYAFGAAHPCVVNESRRCDSTDILRRKKLVLQEFQVSSFAP